MAKKTTKKNKAEKASKNRLVCVMLPDTLLSAVKSYRNKVGFNSVSELLRATVNHASGLKKLQQEPRSQISFRLPEALYASLSRAANQTGQSVARIVRTLLENVSKLGVRPPAIPKSSKGTGTAKKLKSPKKSVATSAKKQKATRMSSGKKVAVKSAKAKSVPAKKSGAKRR